MASKHTRAGTLKQHRLIQIGTAGACVVFVGMALGAVVVDRSVSPAPKPNLPPAPPVGGPDVGGEELQAFVPLIASGLSSVYKMDAPATPQGDEGGEEKRPTPPPQEVVLVAAIGQPGSMMAVIREGAAQTAIGEGQRGGSVDVLEVRPGWARIRHRGVERELTVGKPMIMVSDMSSSPQTPMSSQIIRQPGMDGVETMEEGGVTSTRMPTTFQRSQSGNQGGNQSGAGAGSGRRGASGGSGNSAPAGGNGTGTVNGTSGGQRTTGGQQGQGGGNNR